MVGSIRSAVTALAAATLVKATNPTPPVPLDAQLGELHFPITCQIYGFLNQTFDTVFTATAPVYGGSGEQIYYTDVTGLVTVPSYITSLAPFVSASQASANVSVNLRLTNASPANLLAYKGTINNISFPSGQDAHIRIPAKGVLPNIGPVTLGTAGVAHRIFLGAVSVSIELQDSTGKGVFGPIPVTCGQQNIDYVIGSVNVNSTTGLGPLAPANGFVPSFQPTPENTESGYFRFPYNCNFGALGPQNLDLIIGGTIPTYFAPGQQFYLSNPDAFLRVPASLVALAHNAFPNTATFDTTVTEFDVLFTNASPNKFNGAATPIKSSVAIPADTTQDFIIPIPANGYLPNIGPVTAGQNGQIVGVAVGFANATTTLRDASGNSLFQLAPITCNVPSPLELIGVPITTQKPANYSLGTNNASS